MSMPLHRAIKQAAKGVFPEDDIRVNGHDFYIRSLLDTKNSKLGEGETGYFRHVHIGKDDRVFFSVKTETDGKYEAKLKRIQYRGWGNKGTSKEDIIVTGLLAKAGGWGVATAAALKVLKEFNFQSVIDGDWEIEAAKIIDAIGMQLASNNID